MSYLLECLGRGLLGQLADGFTAQLPTVRDDEVDDLLERSRMSPRSADLAIQSGIACLKNMRYREAKAALERAYELGENPQRAAIALACLYDELGRSEQALQQLSIAQAHDPDDPALAFALGSLYERREEATLAVRSYRRALETCPTLRNAHERLAAIALLRGHFDQAIAAYEILVDLDQGAPHLRLTLAALRLLASHAEQAIEDFQHLLLVEPQADALTTLVDDSAATGELSEALEQAADQVRRFPGVPEFRVQLGDLFARAGEDARALLEYEAAVELQPTFIEATIKLGTQHLRGRRFAPAAKWFNQAMDLNDRLLLAFLGLGLAQEALGRSAEADATFNLAASLEPNTGLLFCESARLHFRAGLPADAHKTDNAALLDEQLRRHHQAVTLRPTQPDLHYRLGMLLRHIGHGREAAVCFRTATQLAPSFAAPWMKLGLSHLEAGQRQRAIRCFRHAVVPTNADIQQYYALAMLFAQRRQFDLAIEQYEGTHGEAPFAARPALLLALQAIGVVEPAAASWRLTCEINDPGAEVRDALPLPQ